MKQYLKSRLGVSGVKLQGCSSIFQVGKKQDTVESNILMRDTLKKTRTVRVDVQHDGVPVEKEDRMTQAGLEKGPEKYKINMLAALQHEDHRGKEEDNQG